jgi:hypothetical protein
VRPLLVAQRVHALAAIPVSHASPQSMTDGYGESPKMRAAVYVQRGVMLRFLQAGVVYHAGPSSTAG